MLTPKQLLIRQTLVIIFMFLFCPFLVDFGYDLYYNVFFDVFKLILFLGFLVYYPLTFIYFERIKSGANINKLNKIFRSANWFFIVLLLLPFLFIFWDLFCGCWWASGFWSDLWYSIKTHFSRWYLTNTEVGLYPDLKLLSPFIVITAFLYWLNRINKALEAKISER